MSGPFELLDSLRRRVGAWWEESDHGLLPILRPMPPYGSAGIAAPVVAVGALLALLVLSGITIAALGVVTLGLLGMYVVLTEVLGISIEIHPEAL